MAGKNSEGAGVEEAEDAPNGEGAGVKETEDVPNGEGAGIGWVLHIYMSIQNTVCWMVPVR